MHVYRRKHSQRVEIYATDVHGKSKEEMINFFKKKKLMNGNQDDDSQHAVY